MGKLIVRTFPKMSQLPMGFRSFQLSDLDISPLTFRRNIIYLHYSALLLRMERDSGNNDTSAPDVPALAHPGRKNMAS